LNGNILRRVAASCHEVGGKGGLEFFFFATQYQAVLEP
jgi:hypothetical protein